jgi:hypothetical protein
MATEPSEPGSYHVPGVTYTPIWIGGSSYGIWMIKKGTVHRYNTLSTFLESLIPQVNIHELSESVAAHQSRPPEVCLQYTSWSN